MAKQNYTILYVSKTEGSGSTIRWKSIASLINDRDGERFIDGEPKLETLSISPVFAGEVSVFPITDEGKHGVIQADAVKHIIPYEVDEVPAISSLRIGDEKDEEKIRDILLNKGFEIFSLVRRNLEEKNVVLVIPVGKVDSEDTLGLVLSPRSVKFRFDSGDKADTASKTITICKIDVGNVENPTQSTPYLPVIDIKKTFRYRYSQSKHKDGRIFLSSVRPREINQFTVHPIKEFLFVFIKRALKPAKGQTIASGKTLTNADISAIMSIVKDKLSENAVGNVADLLKIKNNHFAGEMTFCLNDAIDEFIEKQGGITDNDQLMDNLRNLLWEKDSIRSECIQMGKAQWLKEADEAREKALAELARLEEKNGKLDKLKQSCEEKQRELSAIESKIEIAQKREAETGQKLQAQIQRFREDVSELALHAGLAPSGNVLAFPGHALATKEFRQSERAFFETAKLFYPEDVAQKVEAAVANAFLHGTHIAANPTTAEAVAGILSTAVYGEMPSTVACTCAEPVGRELMHTIQNQPTTVVLVEGMLGVLNDNILLAVMRHIHDKVLVFSIESPYYCDRGTGYATWNYISVIPEDTLPLKPWGSVTSGNHFSEFKANAAILPTPGNLTSFVGNVPLPTASPLEPQNELDATQEKEAAPRMVPGSGKSHDLLTFASMTQMKEAF